MNQKNYPKEIIQDLKVLLAKETILAKDFEKITNTLKTKEVEIYLDSLSRGSKPEQALRESFFSNNSRFAKYLFQDVFPEVNQEGGFLDYLIKAKREEISLEIKPLYDRILEKDKSRGAVFKKIKKLKLKPEDHKDQILRYLEGKREYVVLTNLENWYLFSKSYSYDDDCNFFASADLFELLEDFKQVDDFWYYLDKKEDLSLREPLDTQFYESLKDWVENLNEVEFDTDENEKTELIINFINKFIFIQSLDKFWVIQNNFIAEEWERTEKKWKSKSKLRILEKFIEDIDEYFFELYDTELFKDKKLILGYINKDEDNIRLFYDKFKLILGVDYGVTTKGWIPGIIQYNFRRIDEDILGKAYETYLAEIRKEQGIYYTPKHITKFIVKNTVGEKFDSFIELFGQKIKDHNFAECSDILDNIFSIKILDPACGSGSFLIKALKIIWQKYGIINNLIENEYLKYNDFNNKLVRSEEIEEKFQGILDLKKQINYDDKRDLISKIIVRHLFGNDLDTNALEVTRLNIWLEAIRLTPEEFRWDKLPTGTNHILPNLEINLSNGDALVGFPADYALKYLKNNYLNEINDLINLRREYIQNPQNPELVSQILDKEHEIKADLDKNFKSYLQERHVSSDFLENISLVHWSLDFYYVYFELNVKDSNGFDVIIGNPPYFTIRGKGTGTLTQTYSYEYLKNAPNWKKFFRSQSDIYYYFIIKSIKLLKESGSFGYIIEDYWIENDYADRLREFILDETSLEILIKFGEVKKIFEDADNDTCILIFRRESQEDNTLKYVYCKKSYAIGNIHQNNQKLIEHISSKIDEDEYSDDYIDVFWVDQTSLSEEKWILSKIDKKEIINKIEGDKTSLGELCEVGQGVVPGRKKEFRIVSDEESNDGKGYLIEKEDDYYLIRDKKKEQIHNIESEYLKPLITNSGINKYILEDSQDLLIYTIPFQEGRAQIDDNSGILGYLMIFEEELKGRYDYDGEKYPWYGYQRIQNTELFENNEIKILCPYRAEENRFAIDNVGYFGTTDLYAIVPKSDNLNINYLLGVLNSKLLTFWYMVAGKSKGLVLEFFANPLRKMPIYLPSKDIQNEIDNMVSEIILNKQLIQKYKQIWQEVSVQFRNGTIKLRKLILNDKINIQNGDFDKTYISKTNIFPDSENPILKEEFSDFHILMENDVTLKIFGVKGKREEPLTTIKTQKIEFTEILYLEILDLLNSRRRISKLNHIFKKTIISIIKPNIWEKTHNLINYTKKRFFEYLEEQEIDYDDFKLRLALRRIEDLEIDVDAKVFDLYELDKDEINLVLNTLNITEKTKKSIVDNLGK